MVVALAFPCFYMVCINSFKDFPSNADVLLFNHPFILLKSDLGWKLPSVGLSLYYNSAILIYSCSPFLFLPLSFLFLLLFSSSLSVCHNYFNQLRLQLTTLSLLDFFSLLEMLINVHKSQRSLFRVRLPDWS